MTVEEVFALRNQGRVEDAYEAAREIYAVDKGPYASTAMFWTAVDVLKLRANEDRVDEAKKILMALERLLNNCKDGNGWMHSAMEKCRKLLERGSNRAALLTEGPRHLQLGIWGEEVAADYLREKGYVILERDWHSKHRDIDIVCTKDDMVVFVEVKTRCSRDFADPLQSVNYKKQQNLLRAINHYIHYRKNYDTWRFDVITVVGEYGSADPEISHIEDFSLL